MKITDSDTLADRVDVDLHVFHTLMMHGIGGEIDRIDDAVHEDGAREEAMELIKNLAMRGSLGHVNGHIVILGISTRAGDDRLPLR